MKKAFTLAEALIALAVVGIIAVMTLPMIIKSYQSRILSSQAEKIFSELATGTTSIIPEELSNETAINESGAEVESQGFYDTTAGVNCNELSESETHCNASVGSASKTGAKYFLTKYLKTRSEGVSPNSGTFKKLDGTAIGSIFLSATNSYCVNTVNKATVCMYFDETLTDEDSSVSAGRSVIIVDTNGVNKIPNTVGMDIFAMQVKPNGDLRDLDMSTGDNNKCGKKTGSDESALSYSYGCLTRLLSNDWRVKN